MLRTVFSLLYDEGYDGGKLEGQSQCKDEAAEESGDSIVDLCLLVGPRHRMVDYGDGYSLAKQAVDEGLGR